MHKQLILALFVQFLHQLQQAEAGNSAGDPKAGVAMKRVTFSDQIGGGTHSQTPRLGSTYNFGDPPNGSKPGATSSGKQQRFLRSDDGAQAQTRQKDTAARQPDQHVNRIIFTANQPPVTAPRSILKVPTQNQPVEAGRVIFQMPAGPGGKRVSPVTPVEPQLPPKTAGAFPLLRLSPEQTESPESKPRHKTARSKSGAFPSEPGFVPVVIDDGTPRISFPRPETEVQHSREKAAHQSSPVFFAEDDSNDAPYTPENPFRNVGPTPQILYDLSPDRFWLPPNAPITQNIPGPFLPYYQGMPGGPERTRYPVFDAMSPQVTGLTGARDTPTIVDPITSSDLDAESVVELNPLPRPYEPPCTLTPLRPQTPLPPGNIIDPLSPQVNNFRGPYFPYEPRLDGAYFPFEDVPPPQLVAQDLEDGPYVIEPVRDPIVFFDPINNQTLVFDPLRNYTRFYNPDTDPELVSEIPLPVANYGRQPAVTKQAGVPRNANTPAFWLLKRKATGEPALGSAAPSVVIYDANQNDEGHPDGLEKVAEQAARHKARSQPGGGVYHPISPKDVAKKPVPLVSLGGGIIKPQSAVVAGVPRTGNMNGRVTDTGVPVVNLLVHGQNSNGRRPSVPLPRDVSQTWQSTGTQQQDISHTEPAPDAKQPLSLSKDLHDNKRTHPRNATQPSERNDHGRPIVTLVYSPIVDFDAKKRYRGYGADASEASRPGASLAVSMLVVLVLALLC